MDQPRQNILAGQNGHPAPLSQIADIPEKAPFLKQITHVLNQQIPAATAFISLAGQPIIYDNKPTKDTIALVKTLCERTAEKKGFTEIKDLNKSTTDSLFKDSEHIRYFAGIPLHDETGKNTGTLCIISPIQIELKQEYKQLLSFLAEAVSQTLLLKRKTQYLEATKSDFEKIFNLSPDLLCMANESGYFTKVNESFTACLGYSANELIGVPFMNFVHEEDKEATLDAFNLLIKENKKVILFSNRYCKKDGGYVHLVWNAKPDPETGLIIANARDVSEIDILNERIEKSHQLEELMNKERIRQLWSLADRVSHELLNPVNMIMGFTEMIGELITELESDHNPSNKDDTINLIRTDLDKINEHAKYISRIIQKIDMEIHYTNVPSIMTNL